MQILFSISKRKRMKKKEKKESLFYSKFRSTINLQQERSIAPNPHFTGNPLTKVNGELRVCFKNRQ